MDHGNFRGKEMDGTGRRYDVPHEKGRNIAGKGGVRKGQAALFASESSLLSTQGRAQATGTAAVAELNQTVDGQHPQASVG
jgi:hypothetical protein